MTHPFLEQKYTHLFKILDFDHDGLLQESDFFSIGENISIFRCAPFDEAIEKLIESRAHDIWSAIRHYLHDEKMLYCNLENWIKFLSQLTQKASERSFDLFTHKAVHDIFQLFDKNADNFISKREYLCFFVSLRVGIKQADECFKAMDLNGDLRISREELFLAIKQFFLSEEANAPGNLLFGNSESYKFETRKTHLYA